MALLPVCLATSGFFAATCLLSVMPVRATFEVPAVELFLAVDLTPIVDLRARAVVVFATLSVVARTARRQTTTLALLDGRPYVT